MTLEQLKNWVKQNTEIGEAISLGAIDGKQTKCIGVYPAKAGALQRICLGGEACTKLQALYATLLVHWGTSYPAAEAKAQALHALFYGAENVEMDGVRVCCAEPGEAPVPLGRDARGVFEFSINLKIIYIKE